MKFFYLRPFSLITAFLIVFGTIMPVWSQEIVDKTVAVVSDGNRTELITYSDLIWQLALQPGTPLDPPRSDDLNQALQTMINQRLFALESKRLPRAAPDKAEIAANIAGLVRAFGSAGALEKRLRQVGFDSVDDETFQTLIGDRHSIEKYVDFRFGSFVVVTAEDEARYYRDVYVPEFRRKTPDLLLPSLEESRNEIRSTLTRQRIATAIETFLDEAKRRVNIEILFEV